jgi:hypothetical protein
MLIEFERDKRRLGVMVRLVIEGPPQCVVAERLFEPAPPNLELTDDYTTFKIMGDDVFLTLPPGSYER